MAQTIADVEIPDTRLVAEATELVREAASPLIYHHSRRVYLFGALRGRAQGLPFDPELLYAGAMFHDLGLTERHPAHRPAVQDRRRRRGPPVPDRARDRRR